MIFCYYCDRRITVCDLPKCQAGGFIHADDNSHRGEDGHMAIPGDS